MIEELTPRHDHRVVQRCVGRRPAGDRRARPRPAPRSRSPPARRHRLPRRPRSPSTARRSPSASRVGPTGSGRNRSTLTACGDDAARPRPGEHEIVATDGATTGIDLDRLVLRSGVARRPARVRPPGDRSPGRGADEGRAAMDLRVDGADPGEPFWLVLGQSHNPGWSLDGEDAGARRRLRQRLARHTDGRDRSTSGSSGARSGSSTSPSPPPPSPPSAASPSSSSAAGGVAGRDRCRRSRCPSRRDRGRGRPRSRPRRGRPGRSPLAVAAGTFVAAGPRRCPRRRRRRRRRRPIPPRRPAAAVGAGRRAASPPPTSSGARPSRRPTAAFEWPAEQSTAHGPALAALALLAVTVVLERRRAAPGGE